MNQTIDTEVIESRAVAVRPRIEVDRALSVQEILAQVKLIQEVMRSVMTDGEHYGTIPGCGDKKTLLQPGAQKLTMTFRLAPEYQIQEVNLERGHKEYRVICTLKSVQSGNFVGQGVGCCSSMESKYRWRGGARKCPKCGKETIIKGKAQFGGGWLCWEKKGGCSSKWPDGATEIEGQVLERQENPDPADTFNTVLKMAKKRAFVDATITATAASDIFTQDIGDPEEEATPTAQPNAPQPPPNGKQASTSAEDEIPMDFNRLPKDKPVTTPARFPTAKTREWALEQLKAPENHQVITDFLIKAAILMPGETLSDWPLHWVPSTPAQVRLIGAALAAFEAGEEAKMPYPSHVGGAAQKPIEVPRDTSKPQGKVDEWFMKLIVPIPRKGQTRTDYLKNPDTIGSLFEARHGEDEESQGLRQRLWGFVSHYEPKGWQKKDGTQMPPSDSDKKFREALDAFQAWFEKTHPDEKL